MPSFLTCATSSGIRLAPSSREYSLCVWRWTKDMYAIGRWLFPRGGSQRLLIVLWTPVRATRYPAGHREPEGAPRDDRGDRLPRTRDGRRPPNLPPLQLQPLPRPLSARPFPLRRRATPPYTSLWAARPRAARWSWPAASARDRRDPLRASLQPRRLAGPLPR